MLKLLTHMFKTVSAVILAIFLPLLSHASERVDVLIVGGGASGSMAGIQSARMGVSTLIIEESPWLGGMLTAAGVSAIDGNYLLPSGLFGEFRDSLVSYYGGMDALKTGWVSHVLFEPSAGNRILQKMTKHEPNLKVWLNTRYLSVKKTASGWNVTILRNGKRELITAKILIDATELGDVARICGVRYDIGMDARPYSGEDIAPEKANNIVQDLTYVAILKDYGKGADKTIPKPNGYDPSEFYCSCRSLKCVNPKEASRLWACDSMLTYGKLPNDKYMINWPIEGNDYYVNLVDMVPLQRVKALQKAKDFTLGFVYYLQTELGYKNLGLADDEYPTADKLPFIAYHRESRRIHGLARFTINHITKPYEQPDKLYRTAIAVGDYPVDHHHTRYPNWQELPDLHFYPVPSYGLPLGVLIPEDVKGLIVAEKSISVSNLANGTTRLQPVVIQIGQASGVLAALAVKGQKDVSEVPVRDVQNVLLAARGYLMPYLDVERDDPFFLPLQKIGATGILRGEGRHVDWSNQTWIRANDPVLFSDLKGLQDVYPKIHFESENSQDMLLGDLLKLIRDVATSEKILLPSNLEAASVKILSKVEVSDLSLSRLILRKEAALLIDTFLDPFNRKAVDMKGEFVR